MPKQGGYFDLDTKRAQIAQCMEDMQQPDFWNNQEQAQKVTQTLSQLKEEVQSWEDLSSDIETALELAREFESGSDADLEEELRKQTEAYHKRYTTLEFMVLFSGPFDTYDAIVTVSAGAGGTDAQDWAQMLERMLLRYAERKDFKTQIIDRQTGQEAGIKSVTFSVSGRYAYGWLQSEAGVHRLVRLSPFDADKARHTSFAMVDIIPDLGDVADIDIADEDVRIDVFRASGNGGQSVNTTDSAVRMVHIPTGITVSCQNERSQQQNKAMALNILKSRLAQKQEAERLAKERAIRGETKSAEWGSQIRSYVLHPYKMVKDHRTNTETQDVDRILDGDIETFSRAFVKWKAH